MEIRQPHIYLVALSGAVGLVIIGLGGGLFQQGAPWYDQWQHQAFISLCHQMPDRSFWINGQPMAVCSRCIGIYLGFAMGWIFLPIISLTNVKEIASIKKIVVFTLLLNVMDAVGNYLNLWQNTLLTRLVLGLLLGGAVPLIFIGDFFIKTKINRGSLWIR